jgi:hypothetical protein
MPKKKKSVMEEELESASKKKAYTPDDAADYVLKIIKKHADEVSSTKKRYLDESNVDRYGIYSNIEAAFDILMDDLRKEGFAI